MIPKGNQRGGGQQLATHLLNAFDNERIEVADMRGAVAPDLHGAFAEWQAQSKATNARKYLYSMSVNPDHRQRDFSREDYLEFIDRAEKKLGLQNQPRAIVFHEKTAASTAMSSGRASTPRKWRPCRCRTTGRNSAPSRRTMRAIAASFSPRQ